MGRTRPPSYLLCKYFASPLIGSFTNCSIMGRAVAVIIFTFILIEAIGYNFIFYTSYMDLGSKLLFGYYVN